MDMILDDIFARAKTDARLSKNEIEYARSFLLRDGSAFDYESHRAIYVIFLSCEPSDENVKLLEKFLSEEVIDYNKMAALNGLINYWYLSENYKDYIFYLLRDKLGYDDFSMTNDVALVISLSKIKSGTWIEFGDLIIEKIGRYLDTGIENISYEDKQAFCQIGYEILWVFLPETRFEIKNIRIQEAFRLAKRFQKFIIDARPRSP